MKLSEIISSADKLPKEHREEILKLIDIKTENEMKNFTQAIETFATRFETAERAMERVEKSLNNKLNLVIWFFGVIIAVLMGILGVMISKL